MIKKILHILIFSITVSSLDALPSEKEFRATWVITWEYIGPSFSAETIMEKIDEIMDNHADANMTSVLFQVRQGGTAYYNSSYEPWGYYSNYQNPGFDPLEYAVEAAHSRGLELHAWFNTFQTSSLQEGAPAQVHPEWICRDRDGNPMSSYRALSPGLIDVRNYTVDVAMEIVNNYDIDGLHLDYVRWNEHSSSMNQTGTTHEDELNRLDGIISPDELNILQQRTGRYLYDAEHTYQSGVPSGFSSWEEWWRFGVTELVHSLHDSIQVVKPFVRLSTAVLGRYNWGGWQGYGTVYQDAALWFNEGYIDQLTPMHYHWTSPASFVQMLQGSNQSWGPYIQDGIQNGRLFSVGPGSYILAENNVWNNHSGIVDDVRDVGYIDGFQFFSYGSWDDYLYWEEAGETFFKNKTIVRSIPYNDSTTTHPPIPNLSLIQNSELDYQIEIDPNTNENQPVWTVISIRPTDSTETSTLIYKIFFESENFTVPLSFNGLQPYQGSYIISVQNFNRFWVGSEQFSSVETEIIPAFPPTITNINIMNGDTLPVNQVIEIEFSKKINQNSFLTALNLIPNPTSMEINWSNHWDANGKHVSISFPELLEFDQNYELTITADLTDMIGLTFDGNMDGIGGDGIVFQLYTESTDLTGPQITEFYPPVENYFDIDGIFNFTLDEIIDTESINESSIQIFSNAQPLTIDFVENTINEITTISLKSFAPLLNNTNCEIVINSITDTLGNDIPSPISFSYNTASHYYSNKNYIDRFNSGAGWWQPDGSGSTTGILGNQTQFSYSNALFVPGISMNSNERKSGSLEYAWNTNESTHFLRLHNGGSPSDISLDTSNVIQIYLYGDGSRNLFSISLYEYENESTTSDIIEVRKWEEINWIGWKLIEWDLGNSEQVGDWLSSDEIMDGEEYFLDGFLLKSAEDSEITGRIYFDDLRIVTKSNGTPPNNFAPAIVDLPDTTINNGDNFYFYVNYSDENDSDIHQISIDTEPTLTSTLYGHTSGSLVLLDYEPFIGTSTISVIVNDFGLGELADTIQFQLTILDGLDILSNSIPDKFSLGESYPNPFNPQINIPFTIEKTRTISIFIYDIGGHLVKTLIQNKLISPGYHQQIWNGTNTLGQAISSGTYIIQISSNQKIFNQKVTYIK